MNIKKIFALGKEELSLVVVEAEDEEPGDVVATFKSKTDRNSLASLAKYIKELFYSDEDELKPGSYNLVSKDGKVLRRIKPKRERTIEDLSKMKQDEALAVMKKKRDESIQSITDLKEMQDVFQKEFGVEGGGASGDEIVVPEGITSVFDAVKQAYAKRAYKDIMMEPGSVGKTVNNMANMLVGIGTAVGEYLTAKSKEITKKSADAKKKEEVTEKKEIKEEKKAEELLKEIEVKTPELTTEVLKEGDSVLRRFKELESVEDKQIGAGEITKELAGLEKVIDVAEDVTKEESEVGEEKAE